MSVKVKICGHTCYEDAMLSAVAGADMLGFIFYAKSRRFVPFDEAAAWLGRLPSGALRVGVFVDAQAEEIRRVLRSGLIDMAQLHGNETPEFCRQLDIPFFKAIAVNDDTSLAGVSDFGGDMMLLDAPAPGSGRTFDWGRARQAIRQNPSRRFLLAGGLSPENVGEAIQRVQPWGVDVATGVEASAGVKDAQKVRRFIAEAKTASTAPFG